MDKEKRIKVLQILGIVTLSLISLHYLNELFSTQLLILKTAINAIVLPFGIALFISYLLEPIMMQLEKWLKLKNRLVNVIMVFLILFVIGGIFLYFVGSIIYEQAVRFLDVDWERIIATVQLFLDQHPALNDTVNSLKQFFSLDETSPLILNFFNILKSITSLILVLVLVPVFLFFLLYEKETVFSGIVSAVPKKYKTHIQVLGKRSNEVIRKYFNGRFLVMFIMSILFTIMFLIFGFSFQKSLFFGFILGFLDIIPYVGSFIGITIPVLYSFTVPDQLLFGDWSFIGLIVVNIIMQGFQGGLLQPYIMGKEVNMHPLLVLSSFIFFGSLFGVSGIILAIPITGIIKVTFAYFKETNGT